MQLRDKKIVILGDSITEGVGVSSYEYSYPAVLEKLSGATVYNYGVGGTRYGKQIEEFEPKFNECFIDRLKRIKEYPDLLLIFGGTNDFGHGDLPFGEETDRGEDSYCGSCYSLYRLAVEKFPNARIVVLTPLHRTSENNAVKEIRNIPTLPLEAYVNVQKQAAKYYSLPVIDLYSISGLQPAIDCIREIYMPDGLHPSNAGAKRIAEIIYAQLLSL